AAPDQYSAHLFIHANIRWPIDLEQSEIDGAGASAAASARGDCARSMVLSPQRVLESRVKRTPGLCGLRGASRRGLITCATRSPLYAGRCARYVKRVTRRTASSRVCVSSSCRVFLAARPALEPVAVDPSVSGASLRR